MNNSRVSDIKRAQKEKLFFREISQLLFQLTAEDSRLKSLILNRVKLSPDKGLCTIFFYTPEGEEKFKEALEILKLYKASMRKAIAAAIVARHTPDLRFLYDDSYEKQERLDQILQKIKKED